MTLRYNDHQNDNHPTMLTDLTSLGLAPALPTGRPIGRPTAGRQVGLDRGRRPGGRRNGGFGGQRPPTENLNDFHNDFRPGGRAPAGEAGGKKSKKYYYNNRTNNLLMMMMIFSCILL